MMRGSDLEAGIALASRSPMSESNGHRARRGCITGNQAPRFPAITRFGTGVEDLEGGARFHWLG